jgi:hypothetical protein
MFAKKDDLIRVQKGLKSDWEIHPDMSWGKSIELSEMTQL